MPRGTSDGGRRETREQWASARRHQLLAAIRWAIPTAWATSPRCSSIRGRHGQGRRVPAASVSRMDRALPRHRLSHRARDPPRPGRASSRGGEERSLRTVISAGAVLTAGRRAGLPPALRPQGPQRRRRIRDRRYLLRPTGAASLAGYSAGKPLHSRFVTIKGGRVTRRGPRSRDGAALAANDLANGPRGEPVLLGRARSRPKPTPVVRKWIRSKWNRSWVRLAWRHTTPSSGRDKRSRPRPSRRRGGDNPFCALQSNRPRGAPARLEVAQNIHHRPRTPPHTCCSNSISLALRRMEGQPLPA